MYSNYSITIDKWELHEDYVRSIFRDILAGPNSTFKRFIESTKDDFNIVKEVLEGELIQNSTEKYNNMIAAK